MLLDLFLKEFRWCAYEVGSETDGALRFSSLSSRQYRCITPPLHSCKMRILSPYALGLVFIFLVSIIWAAASILVQYLYSDQSFDSPFLLTYIGTSLFVLFLPSQWVCQKLRQDSQTSYESIRNPEWTLQDHYRAAAKIAPIWFVSNYAYNASLKYTSITSSTVLASTGSLFTFLFAVLLKDERFSMWKLVGVGLGMAGSILTGLHDVEDDNKEENDGRLWGDALGLLSAVGYGAYAVMIRVLLPHDESLVNMQLFFGFVGLWNCILLAPVAIFQLSSLVSLSWIVFGFVVLKGLLDNVLSDYLWARAVVLTSATVATVGLGLTIPLAFCSDVVLGRPNVLDVSSIGGALSVLLGFILVNLGQKEERQQEAYLLESPASLSIPPEQQVPLDSPDRSHMSIEYRDAEEVPVDQIT